MDDLDPHLGQPVATVGPPLGSARAAVIMVHGRGASPADILTLTNRFDTPDVTYLAPAAAGNTWYPYSFLTETSRNEPFLSSALSAIARLVADAEANGVPRNRIVLLGFSQGACLSSEFLIRHPGRWGGLLALSGALIGPPGTTWDETGSFDHTPVFFGCSDVDAHIPQDRVKESAVVFQRMGADVTLRLYAGMGHTVNDDEIEHVKAVIDLAAHRA